jgi:hypothetical protein
MSKENQPPGAPEPEGAFTKLLNYIMNSKPVQTGIELGNSIKDSKAVKSGIELFNYVETTAPYKILTGRAVSTTLSIITGSLAFVGISAAALPVAIIGIVAVGVGIIIDVSTVRGSRQLHQENEYLTKNRAAKSKQDLLLKLEPGLASTLEKDLYHPEREGKRSINQRYIENSVIDQSTLNFGKAMLKNSLGAIVDTAQAVGSGNPFNILKTTATTAIGMYSEGFTAFQISGKQLENQKNIDAERNKPDTPGYNNRKELKAATREQRIQTMALERLITEKPNKETYPPTGTFRHATPEQIQNRFKVIKAEIAAKEKVVNTSRYPVVAFARSVGKDIVRTFNPFSKYTAPEKLVTPEHSNLTKAMEKHERPSVSTGKENVKGVSTSDVKALDVIRKDVAPHTAESDSRGTKRHSPKAKTTSDRGFTKGN